MSRNIVWVVEGQCDPDPAWDYLETEETRREAEGALQDYRASDSRQYVRFRIRKFVAVGSGRNGQSLVLVCAALALAVIGIGLAVAHELSLIAKTLEALAQ
jgi:hypothetical protein